MQTKLTLRLNKKLIDNAKMIAQVRKMHVSKLVSDYFSILTGIAVDKDAINKENNIHPAVRALRGKLKLNDDETNQNDRDVYRKYLEDKFL